MVLEVASLMGPLCRCGGGRIGSVRDFVSSNARREDGEKWTEHIRPVITAMVIYLALVEQTPTASTMGPTLSLSIHQRTINGVQKSAHTMNTTPRIPHLQSDFTCSLKPCKMQKLLGLRTLKQCWRWVLMNGLSQIRTTNPCARLKEVPSLLAINS